MSDTSPSADDAGAHDAAHPVPSEVVEYYERADEGSRLGSGLGLVERARTRSLVERELPPPPAVVADVGCGGGDHAVWLAGLGHSVHASDPVAKHVEETRALATAHNVELASATVGHGADLRHVDASFDAVLALGPLYHLPEPAARAAVLGEALRVLRPGGVFLGAAISRFTSMVNAVRQVELLAGGPFLDIVHGDLGSGRHENPTGDPEYFTTAYVHDPVELASELRSAGFTGVEVVAVEGLAWAVDDLDALWSDATARSNLMRLLELTEREPTILGASTHLLAIGRRADDL